MNLRFGMFVLCGVVVFLHSCSSRFRSKEEASNAQRNFLEGGKEVVVVDIPTNEEVVEARRLNRVYCRELTYQFVEGFETREELNKAFELNDIHCDWQTHPNGYPIEEKINAMTLTKHETKKTRVCNNEMETSQFVCKEWKVGGDRITKSEWIELKPSYSYFRY